MVSEYLAIGLSLGITAGLSPGPLMALVISETLRKGRIQGIKVSLAPLFTDIPLILLITFVLKHIKDIEFLLGIISAVGSIFLFYLGYRDFKRDNLKFQTGNMESNSFRKGILTNLLNPHPYVFWLFVGVPFMINGNSVERVVFVVSFLSGIVGSKICLALIAEKSKSFIKSKYYVMMIKSLGLILIFFGLILLKDAIVYLSR
jgi:threonine/homoserine/homoserine lactone efflux protein